VLVSCHPLLLKAACHCNGTMGEESSQNLDFD
jgi:hypothetical protein